MHNAIQLPANPGTYVLLVALEQPALLSVGRLGKHTLPPGHYAYVGSARGPGGLRARVRRHLRTDKTPHWHIDALTACAPVIAVWHTASPERLECTWAKTLTRLSEVTIPIAGFGSSDCACPAHLLALPHSMHQQAHAMLDRPRIITENV